MVLFKNQVNYINRIKKNLFYFIFSFFFLFSQLYSLGIKPNDMKIGLGNARLLPNRYEVKKYQGITIINDAYNANPKSMQEALKTLKNYQCKGRRFFIIGDMLELGDLAESAHIKLGEEVAKHSIDYLVSVGGLSALATESAIASGMKKKQTATALEHKCAVAFLKKYLRSGDCLLVNDPDSPF